jgi:hypothetical protein
MPVPDKAEAERFFAPHFDRFTAALADGFSEYDEIDPKLRAKNRSRSKSSNINDFISHRIQEEFDGVGGAVFVERHGAIQLILENTYRVKFKKLDRRLRAHNVPTQTVMAFWFQAQQILPFTPDPVANVWVGYTATKSGALEGIYIVCPQGRHNAWEIPLGIERAASQPITFPSARTAGQGSPKQRRIVPKKPDQTAASDTP